MFGHDRSGVTLEINNYFHINQQIVRFLNHDQGLLRSTLHVFYMSSRKCTKVFTPRDDDKMGRAN